jgi:hypothetical protein
MYQQRSDKYCKIFLYPSEIPQYFNFLSIMISLMFYKKKATALVTTHS